MSWARTTIGGLADLQQMMMEQGSADDDASRKFRRTVAATMAVQRLRSTTVTRAKERSAAEAQRAEELRLATEADEQQHAALEEELRASSL